MRRDSSDLEWKKVKERVFKRDSSCRLCKVLRMNEYLILKGNAGSLINVLDPAHYLAVSARPDLCYKSYNICALNHYSHTMLDDCKSPIDGHPISKEEAQAWWIRILKGNEDQYSFLRSKNLIEGE